MYSSLCAMGASLVRLIINLGRFLYQKISKLLGKKSPLKLDTKI